MDQSITSFRFDKTLLCTILGSSFILPITTQAALIANTPGLTELQITTGAAVQTVCAGLAGGGETISASPNTAADDLFNQCNAMVHTSNQIQNAIPTSNSLNLSADELGSALQNIATEEMGTTSRISLSTLSGQNAEVTSHLASLHNFGQGFGGGGGDDTGSLMPNNLSVFVNGLGGFGDIKSSSREDKSDFYSAGVIVGADYRFNDHVVAGIAGGYSHLNSDFSNSLNVAGGGIDSDTYNVSLFSTFDLNNFYADAKFTYGWTDFDIDRKVVVLSNNAGSTGGANRTATASPDGQQYSAGVGFGYNHQVQAFNIRPYARLDYSHGNIDSYNESGAFGLNLSVDEQNFESLQTVVGTAISYTSSHSFGVVIPQINFGWHHEFLNKSRGINARYTADFNNNVFTTLTDNPDQDYFTLGFAVSTVLQGGVQLFFNHQSLLGYRNINSYNFEAGVRLEF